MSPLVTPSAAPARPLSVSLLLGVSGWVAGCFLLVFVALLFRPDTAGEAAVSGGLLLAAAWGLFTVDRDGQQVFVTQLALALSIAGQCLVLFAMAKDTHGIAPVAGAALVLQTVLVLVMPNRLHRTLSTLFALIAWALTLRFGLFGEPQGWSRNATPHAAPLPAALAGWLLAWLPVAALLWYAIRREAAWAARSWAPAISSIITGLIVGLAFATLASHPFESFRWFGAGQADIGLLALWPLLSALGALGALAAAFALRRRGLMVMCVIATLLHIGNFYYALGTTLLAKSLLMLTMGGLLLVLAQSLRPKESA